MTTEDSKTLDALKKVFTDVVDIFAEQSDKVADIVLDRDEYKVESKNKGIKKETLNTFKCLPGCVTKNFKGIGFKDVVLDTSYEFGRVSRVTKNTCAWFLKGFVE
jgi:hypothetical protein